MDVFPTLLDIMKSENDFSKPHLGLNGKSLFEDASQQIVTEDQSTFFSEIILILDR